LPEEESYFYLPNVFLQIMNFPEQENIEDFSVGFTRKQCRYILLGKVPHKTIYLHGIIAILFSDTLL
jgi:hypothetical protein